MLTVRSVSIRSYRAIERLEFSPRSINVFVGPNNCGKSSILEAIALNLSLNNNFNDYIRKNIWRYLLFSKKYDPQYILFNEAEKGFIECDDHKITIETVEGGFPEGEIGQKVLSFFQGKIDEYLQRGPVMREFQNAYFSDYRNGMKTAGKQTTLLGMFVPFEDSPEDLQDHEMYETAHEFFRDYIDQLKSKILLDIEDREKVIFCGYAGGKLENITISMSIPMMYRSAMDNIMRNFYIQMPGIEIVRGGVRLIPVFQSPEAKKYQTTINFEHSNLPLEINQLHDLVISNNKITQSLGRLKEKIAYFEDIRKTDRGLQIFLKGQSTPLPISSMGDGFSSLLKLTFMNSLAGGGTVILEEPEVSLHPGFIYILCEAILDSSKESQFFISSHSMDFVRALLKVAQWAGRTEDVQIIRMHPMLEVQSLDIEVLSGDEALSAIEEIGRDLRGI